MSRVYNFSAGPSMLPEPVLERAAKEMLDYKGTGISITEMSHRSKVFASVIESAENILRKLMGIPDNYSVLFLQGGASLQFAMVPANIMGENGSADYINTGSWSKKAMKEASFYGSVNIASSSEDRGFTYIPRQHNLSASASYVHITSNNTIEGTRFTEYPETWEVPLVADMSSNILSEKIDVRKFGIIYAGAQKNLGPAGVTLVIIRNDLIGKHFKNTPTMLRYDIHAENKSLYNTPTCFAIYMIGLVLEWLDNLGGVEEIEKINIEKAKLLYEFLDNSKLFSSPVEKRDRSLMNVPFVTPDENLNAKFIAEATKQGLCELKGHRSVGGMRASIYNAMPVEGVKKLVEFMKDFEKNNT